MFDLQHTIRVPFVIVALALGATTPLVAQDPFGEPGVPMPMQPANVQPAPMQPAPMQPAPMQPAAPARPATDDIVILSVRESNPTTPAELVAAAKSMADYGAFSEAKFYLAQLIAARPTGQQLATLEQRFGSSAFMELMLEKQLAPEGLTLGRAVLQAAHEAYTDPLRLKALATEATGADPLKRQLAIAELRGAAGLAVMPLIEILRAADQADAHQAARDALIALGADAVEPLIGALESNDAALRAHAIVVLARLKPARLTPHLLAPAFDPKEDPRVQEAARAALTQITRSLPKTHEIEAYLSRKTNDYHAGSIPLTPDADGVVTLWRWNESQHAAQPHSYPANIAAIRSLELRSANGTTRRIEESPASIVMAAQLARDLFRLFPDKPEYRRLFLVTHLEAAKLGGGIGRPLATGPGTVFELASLVDATAIEDALAWSMKNGHIPAAIAAAEVLGEIGNEGLLLSTGGEVRPLALALRHADRRLRFAAVQSILRFKPKAAFPGASYVPETLGFLAGSVGQRRVLVADPRLEEARKLGGLFAQHGYETDIAATGTEAMQRALRSPEYEIVLLSDSLDNLDQFHTWHQLRKDPRTAKLLVALLSRDENLTSLHHRSQDDKLARAMPYIHDAETLTFQLRMLFTKAGIDFVPHEERQRQAIAALGHLSVLANDATLGKHYDLLRQEAPLLRALQGAGLVEYAGPALGGLATPAAQRALVDFASDLNIELADREIAAKAFAAAVARRGILLTSSEILRQYDRYNASAQLDPDTQRLLGSLLDTLERK